MKYFIDATQREASGLENYIEFQGTNATKEFWDENSLYMSYDSLEKAKFNSFICFCAFNDILLDGDTISGKEWVRLLSEAEKFDINTYEAFCELHQWLENQTENPNLYVSIIRESDRRVDLLSKTCYSVCEDIVNLT